MRHIRPLLVLLLLNLVAVASPAQPRSSIVPMPDEVAIRALIDRWYIEQRAGPEGRVFALLAPGAINATPGYEYGRYPSRRRPAVSQPRIYTSLAATSLTFRHEISGLVLDTRFARVRVWERAYFYASASQETYERLGAVTFVLEKQDDGRWLVLAHQTGTIGIPPNMATDPMPDLRGLFYSTCSSPRLRERCP